MEKLIATIRSKVNSFELSSSTGICQYALLAFSFVKNIAFDICAKISSVVDFYEM